MQKKKRNKPIKQIIAFIAIIILVLLIAFVEDIIKLNNKNKTNLAENSENELISNEPNQPQLSAGMIPVKWNGTNWIITTANDKDWYDYSKGKPAYIMLNDGYYQSELIRDMSGKELAENNVGVGVPDDPKTRGTIFVWIPRFAINNETNNIKYIQGIEQTNEEWMIPDIFTYEQALETAPDFVLTGIWIEKDVDTNYANKITQMNQEESIYGFIKNTIAMQSDVQIQNEIQNYITNTVGAHDCTLDDPINPNRVILKIINQNNQDPIKAKGSYNKYSALMTIQVTYTKNGINKIVLEDENELEFSEVNGIITANTNGIELEDGNYTITITDNKNNKKKLIVKVINAIYAVYYTDGTLAFGKNNNPLPEKTREKAYDISNLQYTSGNSVPWYFAYYKTITTVNFVNKISPNKTAYWFVNCSNLTTVYNANNLNMSNVIDTESMFSNCKNLKAIDTSVWNTSRVTNMRYMFANCSSLTRIDVSNFDTSNVTNMQSMFSGCSGLTSLDVSSFDTSKVTNMSGMFYYCTNLSNLDVSKFNTSRVTDMSWMFRECKSLTSIDISSFNVSNATMQSMFQNCSKLKTIYVSRFTSMWPNNITNSSSGKYQYIFSNCGTSTVTRK